ncbi:MAG: ATP-binding protein [Campylobacterota bacterium]|nr:ATP-binding protein [Campylobacterota bacterium]
MEFLNIEALKQINKKQTKIYNKLYQIGKSLNETITINELYDIATSFTTEELNFEKCLIFEHDDTNGWFKVVKSIGYNSPIEKKILTIINLLLSGEVIESLRINKEPIIHTKINPKKEVSSLTKSLFLSEAYFELFGGDIDIPYGLIIIGNGTKDISEFSQVGLDQMVMLALGNFTQQFSNTINNIVFYKAWQEEKNKLKENIEKRTKQIEDQKKTFEAIYKTSKDGIAILDIETTAFLDINKAYADITGYSKNELLQTSCLKLSADYDKKRSKNAIEEVISKGFITNFIKTCIAKNGNHIITNMSIALMDDKKRMLVSIKDITKQKELEENLLKSKLKAEESTKAKSEFLAKMSHEIRTPMNGILGMSHLALNTSLNDKQRNYLEKIDNSAKNLLGIINDILDFSKIEAGKLSLNEIDFNLNDLVDSSISLIQYKAKEKNLKLIVSYDKDICYNLIGDRLRISQILTNLLDNAVKFTTSGEIGIYIKRITDDKYRFEISDTGIGLSKEQQNKLFQSFSQVDNSTTRKYGGTGLGLSISKQLIKLMGGEIWVESKIDIGSKFIFEITLKNKRYKKNDKQFYNKDIKDISILKSNNILLVEDNYTNQEIVKGLLENSGINIDVASNGAIGVELFNKNKYELILMDIRMPIMDGYEATKIIKKLNKNIPIIALSADAMKDDIEKTKLYGMDEHLKKPIDINKLYEILFRYIKPKNNNQFNDDNIKIPIFNHIDTTIGLKYVNQNKKLYIKILNKFYNSYKDMNIDLLKEDELKRYIHTIKGLSANIGAKNLNLKSQELETNQDKNKFFIFKENLNLVLDELKDIDLIQNKTLISIDKELKKELFLNLKEAIKSKRTKRCIPIVEELDKYLLDDKDKDIFEKIKNHLSNYNFKDAISLFETTSK